MATVATLVFNQFLRIVFDSYNGRFEGTYPNLKYRTNIRARYEATAGGNFSLASTCTFKFGGLSSSYYMSYSRCTTQSSWYEVGTTSDSMGCSRSKTWSVSVSHTSSTGYPECSGSGSYSSGTVSAPTIKDITITDLTEQSFTFNSSLSSNPYNLYVLRLYDVDNKKFLTSSLNGDYSITDLEPNTTYNLKAEAWLADLSGSLITSKQTAVTTLEKYNEITINDVSYTITEGEETDEVTFTVSTSNDEKVSSLSYTTSGGLSGTSDSLTFTLTGLEKNLDNTITITTTDTLNRTSASYTSQFKTTFTYMECWVFNGTEWQRGYSMELASKYNLCKLFAFNGTEWLEAIPYEEETTDTPIIII